jgi:NAD(P)-dependent dehydrogenase (short-subunit alcohol dehydrogenase family)
MPIQRSDRLAGECVLVTGASSGIGEHAARLFAAAGALVALGARRADRIDVIVAEIRAAGGRAYGVDLDVTDEKIIASAFDHAEAATGTPVTVLVNNAGIASSESALTMSHKAWKDVFETNLSGAFLCAQAFAKRRVAAGAGGAIVNVASIVGMRPMGNLAAYGAGKAGLVALTSSLAMEWARYGIRVNALAPVARTAMTAVFGQGAVTHQLEFPPPESVAPIVVYLAGEASRQLRGQVLSFDGTRLSVWSHPAAASTWTRPGGWTASEFGDVLTPETMEDTHPDHWGAGILGG